MSDGSSTNEAQGATRVNRLVRGLVLALRVTLPVAILCGAAVAVDRLTAARPEVARADREERTYAVETALVARSVNRPTLTVYGEVVPARVAELRTLVAGEVVALHPDMRVGGHVAAGDVLLEVDAFPYRGALTEAEAGLAEIAARIDESRSMIALETAQIARVREQLEIAGRDLARAEELHARGALTEQLLDERRLVVSQRRQALDQREHALAVEKARLEQQLASRQRLEWQRDRAARDLENTRLKAPFDGIVAEENLEIGRLLNANDMVVRLHEEDALDVRFVLSDLQYGRLIEDGSQLVGRPVHVIWRIGDRPLSYEAVVSRIGAEISAVRGGIDVYARLQVKDDLPPRPGAFVAIVVPGREYPDSVRLAAEAVYGDKVFVVEGGRLSQRQVRVLAYDGPDAIVAGALATGDEVLTSRLVEAGEGLKVKPVNVRPDLDPEATADAGRRERS